MLSIKSKQRQLLQAMFNFNQSTPSSTWKVLVYDKDAADIIAPLLRVGKLRECGITLHMLLHKPRERIEDVPAIYFIRPTKENVDRLAEDCAKSLYSSFHVNFTSSVSKELMEVLAEATLKSSSVHKISSIHDQHTDFIALENSLFDLRQHNSYIMLNDPNTSNEEAKANLNHIVSGIFSLLVTLGEVPIIRCKAHSAAELLARSLHSLLQSHLLHHPSSSSSSSTRPVLIIMDRNLDMTPMLHHAWSYQALIHQLLDFRLNRLAINVKDEKSEEATAATTQRFDLDEENDDFWKEHRASPFPEMASAAHEQLKSYTESKKQLSDLGGIDVESENFDAQLFDKTQGLKNMADSIPKLRAKKKIIDKHINIGTALLSHLRERELNVYYTLEESIITRTMYKPAEVTTLLETKGTIYDKLMLLLVYYLNADSISEQKLISMLPQSMQGDTEEGVLVRNVINYVKKNKVFCKNAIVSTTSNATQALANSSGIVQRGIESVSDIFSFVQSGVNSFVRSKAKQFYITRITDQILTNNSNDPSSEVDNFLYFDPKIKLNAGEAPRKKTPFKEAIVFMLGGGNYVEYENLQEYAKSTNKNIIYGATEIMSSKQFLDQLQQLGSKLK